MIRLLVWVLRLVIFIALFGLAIKNSGPVELRFFLDHSWQAPFSLVLLAVFACGVSIGLAAALGGWVKQRRELAELKARLAAGIKDHA